MELPEPTAAQQRDGAALTKFKAQLELWLQEQVSKVAQAEIATWNERLALVEADVERWSETAGTARRAYATPQPSRKFITETIFENALLL
eukprot:6457818-Amphidinium_carterae.1